MRERFTTESETRRNAPGIERKKEKRSGMAGGKAETRMKREGTLDVEAMPWERQWGGAGMLGPLEGFHPRWPVCLDRLHLGGGMEELM